MPFGCHYSISNSFLPLPLGNNVVYYFILVSLRKTNVQNLLLCELGNQKHQVTEWLPWGKN